MIIVIAKCQVKEGKLEKFVAEAQKLVDATRKEKGNISYDLIQETTSNNSVAFVERWENQDVLDVHMKTDHFTAILPKLGALTEGDMNISVNNVLI
ncbi:putative quinol monooxygenase [Clostridium sp. Marseille-P2415]|uniref:putative quinol monooxygenase n=1 Tax=Clostridium sp. Marseille-P2415 TaxID=1805471 RepID=UPI0009884A5D|nr:putative quinol monooxygenase [Clostridium sp. Marseille-P2415]